VRLQYAAIESWAELITAHSLAGPSVVAGLKKGAGSEPRGVFLLADFSSEKPLTGLNYAKGRSLPHSFSTETQLSGLIRCIYVTISLLTKILKSDFLLFIGGCSA